MLQALLLLGILLGPPTQAPQETGVLQGTVRRGDTSDPIGGVQISLFVSGPAGGAARLQTVTDGQGRFLFEAVPFGRYMVQASRDGYFTHPRGLSLPYSVATVTVGVVRPPELLVDLVPGAVLAGLVTDPQGEPLQGVRISATELQYKEGRPAFGVGTYPNYTNARGEFRITSLAPGEYYVRAEYVGTRNNLARTSYFPGTVDPSAAVSLRVGGGDSVDNLKVVLPVTQSVRISGRVIPADAGPAANFVKTFYLLPLDGRPLENYPLEFNNLESPGEGGNGLLPFTLDLRGVAPGRYDLAPFYMDSTTNYHSGRTRIDIEDQNIENVNAVITRNVDVTGRLVVEGTTPLSLNGLYLHLRSKDAAVPLMTRTAPARIEPDGTFVIRGVFEGRYQLYLSASSRGASSDLYVAGIRQGAQDLRNTGVIDVRGSTLPIEIQLRAGAGIIQGVVEGPAGTVPPYADVVLVPQFPFRENVLFYGQTTISDKGQFKFEGVAPGEYKVFAFERLADTAEQNPAFIARYETLGEVVTARPQATTEIKVRLVR